MIGLVNALAGDLGALERGQITDLLLFYVEFVGNQQHPAAAGDILVNHLLEFFSELGRRSQVLMAHFEGVGREVNDKHVILLDPFGTQIEELFQLLEIINFESFLVKLFRIGRVEFS